MNKTIGILRFILVITVALFLFLWSLDIMIETLTQIGGDTVLKVINITSNPFISLFIGLFITAVIQSSSTSTSLIVAIVASGNLTLENAVPMVMGANIGTTLTSTIVSLGYITNNTAFKKALSCGVIHDFINIITVTIIFPLEYYYMILSKLAAKVSAMIVPYSDETVVKTDSGFKIFDTLTKSLVNVTDHKILLIVGSFACLFLSIKLLSKLLSSRFIETAQEKFKEVFFENTIKSFGLGTLLTAVIQSSSISTTVIVPLAATSKITIERIFPYILGANLGTTITALIAAFNKSEAAISIAIAHFLFNAIGTCIFLLIPIMRRFAIKYAKKFAQMTVEYKIVGFVYILVIFFILPLALIFVTRL